MAHRAWLQTGRERRSPGWRSCVWRFSPFESMLRHAICTPCLKMAPEGFTSQTIKPCASFLMPKWCNFCIKSAAQGHDKMLISGMRTGSFCFGLYCILSHFRRVRKCQFSCRMLHILHQLAPSFVHQLPPAGNDAQEKIKSEPNSKCAIKPKLGNKIGLLTV